VREGRHVRWQREGEHYSRHEPDASNNRDPRPSGEEGKRPSDKDPLSRFPRAHSTPTPAPTPAPAPTSVRAVVAGGGGTGGGGISRGAGEGDPCHSQEGEANGDLKVLEEDPGGVRELADGGVEGDGELSPGAASRLRGRGGRGGCQANGGREGVSGCASERADGDVQGGGGGSEWCVCVYGGGRCVKGSAQGLRHARV
jgi:hypothetical protein